MPERPPSFEPARLKRNIEWALRHAFEERDVLPMVEALARSAERGSRDWVFAHRQLAELVVEKHPWRAAIAARMVARFAPDDDGARALQGLALTLLGHYRCAVRAYRAALGIAPDNPWYAHNLGHLLDVALNRPHEALGLLRRAFLAEPHPEIAASLAHALARTGRVDEAKRVLSKALRGSRPTADQAALLEWLDQGAPLVRPGAGKGRGKKQQKRLLRFSETLTPPATPPQPPKRPRRQALRRRAGSTSSKIAVTSSSGRTPGDSSSGRTPGDDCEERAPVRLAASFGPVRAKKSALGAALGTRRSTVGPPLARFGSS